MRRIRASNTWSPGLLRNQTDRLLKAIPERLSFLHPETIYDIYMYIFVYINKSFMLIFPYTVYNLFTNMAMSTNIIYLNFIFKDMPIRAFILRGGPPAEGRLPDDRPDCPLYGPASIDGKTLSLFQKGASYGRLFFVSFGIPAYLCAFGLRQPGGKPPSLSHYHRRMSSTFSMTSAIGKEKVTGHCIYA